MRHNGRLTLRARLVAPLTIAAALALPAGASAASFPLQAWWPLAEGKGQVIRDWSGKGHDGFLTQGLAK